MRSSHEYEIPCNADWVGDPVDRHWNGDGREPGVQSVTSGGSDPDSIRQVSAVDPAGLVAIHLYGLRAIALR